MAPPRVSSYTTNEPGRDRHASYFFEQLAGSTASVLHTPGCIYAETGKTSEARETLLQAMDAGSLVQPKSNSWYGFGRIAEQYGEREVALTDYAK
jgi:hypothetical protein